MTNDPYERNRTVRFADGPHKTILLASKTPKERTALFYRKQEIHSFRDDAQNDLKCWLDSKRDRKKSSSNICTLGLDKLLNPMERRRKYFSTVQVLRDEQRRQESCGVHDPDTISKLAAMCSRWDRVRAEEQGVFLDKGVLLCRSPTKRTPKRHTRPTSKKRVSFGGAKPHVMYHENSRTPEEVHATWYSREEIKSFKEDNNATVLKCKDNGLFVSSETHCFRGLERYVPSLLETRRSQKAVVVLVVEEDKNQRKRGARNDAALCRLSQLCSRRARQRALEFAALDDVFAASCDESPREKRQRIVAACRRVMAVGLPRSYSLVARH